MADKELADVDRVDARIKVMKPAEARRSLFDALPPDGIASIASIPTAGIPAIVATDD